MPILKELLKSIPNKVSRFRLKTLNGKQEMGNDIFTNTINAPSEGADQYHVF
jgi:hypothetical protein